MTDDTAKIRAETVRTILAAASRDMGDSSRATMIENRRAAGVSIGIAERAVEMALDAVRVEGSNDDMIAAPPPATESDNG